jgi:hypothetical protein
MPNANERPECGQHGHRIKDYEAGQFEEHHPTESFEQADAAFFLALDRRYQEVRKSACICLPP